jgi:hypothetical protein
MSEHEAHREANDRYFGSEPPVNYGDDGARSRRDETGEFQIRVVYLDGVERHTDDPYTSLREALEECDATRASLKGAGYGRTRVHVDVIDLNDGERRLDWSTLD